MTSFRNNSARALRATAPVFTVLALLFSSPSHAQQNFTIETVAAKARDMAQRAYEEPPQVPQPLLDLNYDQYRSIRFRMDANPVAGCNCGFGLDLFHGGFFFKHHTPVSVIRNGEAQPILFSKDLFDYGPEAAEVAQTITDGGFSGIRLRFPLNSASYNDEFFVLQGASYFRGIAAGQFYGLSARGIALGTASPEGEEFPAFREYWVVEPKPEDESIRVFALLDSPSLTGAYQFDITPGRETVTEVTMHIFPRKRIENLGLGALTSMFLFNESNPGIFKDFRNAVHDSEGLLIEFGNGDRLWRALSNPRALQVSVFSTENMRGFGLMQRSREPEHYDDLEAFYEKRPSAWIEPVGNWAPGNIHLVEIPTEMEVNDNIVAFWRPAAALEEGQSYSYKYRLTWLSEAPREATLAKVIKTMGGENPFTERKIFVVEFENPGTGDIKIDFSASKGAPTQPVLQRNPHTNQIRVSFELDPQDENVSELRLALRDSNNKPLSEIWTHRWTR